MAKKQVKGHPAVRSTQLKASQQLQMSNQFAFANLHGIVKKQEKPMEQW